MGTLELAQQMGLMTRRIERLETLENPAPGTSTWPGFSDASGNPANLGTVASDGVSAYPARLDHVHTYGTAVQTSLNADLLDGQHGTAFATSAHTHTEYSGTAHTHTAYSGTAHTHSIYSLDTHNHFGYITSSGGTITGALSVNGGINLSYSNLVDAFSVETVGVYANANALTLYDNYDVARLTVAADTGRIGIHTASPSYTLHVAGTAAAVGPILSDGAADNYARFGPISTQTVADAGSASLGGAYDGFALVFVSGQKAGALYLLRGSSGTYVMATNSASVFGTASTTGTATNLFYSGSELWVGNNTGASRNYSIILFGAGGTF